MRLRTLKLHLLWLGSSTVGWMGSASAQVVFSNFPGRPPQTFNAGTGIITPGQGIRAGKNLFHSFSAFNVAANQKVTFQGYADTDNIVARVTGTGISNINGELATASDENLYLINPNGIVFGRGASLRVGGTFTASTAEHVQFGDQGVLVSSGTDEAGLTLLSAAPSAFGFLPQTTANSGKITLNQGVTLRGAERLSMIGRQVDVGPASLTAKSLTATATGSGAAEVAADHVISSGGSTDALVRFDGITLNLKPAGNLAAYSSGDIVLSSPDIDYNGDPNDGSASAPGKVDFDAARNLSITGGTIFAYNEDVHFNAGGYIDLTDFSLASTFGGGVVFDSVGDIRLADFTTISSTGGILLDAGGDLTLDQSRVFSPALASGGGADLKLSADGSITLSNLSSVDTTASGHRGSKLIVDAGGDLLVGGESTIYTLTEGAGDGGEIHVTTRGGVRLATGGNISSQCFPDSTGDGGDIRVDARTLTIEGAPEFNLTGIQSDTSGSGTGGDIRVEVPGAIMIGNAGQLTASTSAAGDTGSVIVHAGSLLIRGLDYEPENPSANVIATGINLKGSQASTGNLGNLTVTVDGAIRLLSGGLIDATAFAFNNQTTAGSVTVRAATIHADRMNSPFFTGIGSGTESSEPGKGSQGGSILVAADTIRLLGGAQIAASTNSAGSAGNVAVRAGVLEASGRGMASDWIFSRESGVVAESVVDRVNGAASGSAGTVSILAGHVRIGKGATISSRSVGTGSAGGIKIRLGTTLALPGGVIEVSSANGDAGDMEIRGGSLLDLRGGSLIADANNNGGNITLSGVGTLVTGDGEINANAILETGGNINIEAARYLPGNTIPSASSQLGVDGEVDVDAGEILTESGDEIEVAPLDLTDSIQPECTQRLPTEAGSFIRAGRGGTRRLPGGFSPSVRLVPVN